MKRTTSRPLLRVESRPGFYATLRGSVLSGQTTGNGGSMDGQQTFSFDGKYPTDPARQELIDRLTWEIEFAQAQLAALGVKP